MRQSSIITNHQSKPLSDVIIDTYIHTYTLFMLEIYRVAVELMYSRYMIENVESITFLVSK